MNWFSILIDRFTCHFVPKSKSPCLAFQHDTINFKGPDGVLLCYRTELFDEIKRHQCEEKFESGEGKHVWSSHVPIEIIFLWIDFLVLCFTRIKTQTFKCINRLRWHPSQSQETICPYSWKTSWGYRPLSLATIPNSNTYYRGRWFQWWSKWTFLWSFPSIWFFECVSDSVEWCRTNIYNMEISWTWWKRRWTMPLYRLYLLQARRFLTKSCSKIIHKRRDWSRWTSLGTLSIWSFSARNNLRN